MYLHSSTDVFPVSKDLWKTLGAKNITERGLSQEPGGTIGICHIGNAHCCILDTVVYDRIHRDSHAVFGQNLKKIKHV